MVSMQMYLVSLLSKFGVIPIPIRRYKRSDLDDLIANEDFHKVTDEEIYSGASSYFVVVKKASNS